METALKRVVAWALAPLVAVILGGCSIYALRGPSEPNPSDPPPSYPAGDALPAEITLNVSSPPARLDSALATDIASQTVLEQVGEGLVRMGPTGQLQPSSGQAAGWTVSADGRTYTFRLKAGLRWSDGQPVRAANFAYAWLRALDPKRGGSAGAGLWSIQGAREWAELDPKSPDFARQSTALKKKVAIATPDDQTVQVTLRAPAPYFLSLLTQPVTFPQRPDVVERSAEAYGLDASQLVFNGPFLIKSWTGPDVELVRNPDYWDADMVKTSSTTLHMTSDEESHAYTQPAATWYLAFNLFSPQHSYLQNVHIRRAISLAIDREQLTRTVLPGAFKPATGLVPFGVHLGGQVYRRQAGGFLPTKVDRAAAAAELRLGLHELGLTQLPDLLWVDGQGLAAQNVTQTIADMLKQSLGVQVRFVRMPVAERLQSLQRGDFDLVLAGLQAGYDDPSALLDAWVTGAPYNDAHWSNKEYDRLIQDAQQTQDARRRLADYARAEKILCTELPIVPLYQPSGLSGAQWQGMIPIPVGPAFDLKLGADTNLHINSVTY